LRIVSAKALVEFRDRKAGFPEEFKEKIEGKKKTDTVQLLTFGKEVLGVFRRKELN